MDTAQDTFDLSSFNPLGVDAADPYPFLRHARENEPVFFSAALGAWCVTRYNDIMEVVTNTDTYSSRDAFPRPRDLPPETEEMAQWLWSDVPAITFLDPPEHTRVRTVVRAGFTPRALAAFEPDIRDIIEEYAARLVGRDRVDLVSEFAVPLPLSVVMHVIGIPRADHGIVQDWVDALTMVIVDSAFADRQALVESAATHRRSVAPRTRRVGNAVVWRPPSLVWNGSDGLYYLFYSGGGPDDLHQAGTPRRRPPAVAADQPNHLTSDNPDHSRDSEAG